MSEERLTLDEQFDAKVEAEAAQWYNRLLLASELTDRPLLPSAFDKGFVDGPEVAISIPRHDEEAMLESIVLTFLRPSIPIRHGAFEIPQSPTWAALLKKAQPAIGPILPGIGRIELDNHPRKHACGSGFLLPGGIVATNRHVADEFVERNGEGYRFATTSRGRSVSGKIDFKEEDTNPIEEDEHVLTDILYVADRDGHDVALFKCPSASERPTLSLSDEVTAREAVATIGYPAEDGELRQDLREAAQRIFGDVYDVKRLSPGKIQTVTDNAITHDCTTLHGNSGSVLVKLATGEAVGVHYGGGITKNFAVPASEVMRLMDRVIG